MDRKNWGLHTFGYEACVPTLVEYSVLITSKLTDRYIILYVLVSKVWTTLCYRPNCL